MAAPSAAQTVPWAGRRVVVVDVETTGLSTTKSRIVSFGVAEVKAGRVQGSFGKLVNPGLAHIGADFIHGITADMLRGEPAFAVFAPVLLDWFTPRDGETVILAGQNVLFDALMLNAELTRLGMELTPVLLLDTAQVAQAAGVDGSSLAALTASLGLVALDEHTAIADAQVTATALIKLVEKMYDADPAWVMDDLAVPFSPTLRLARSGKVTHADRDDEPLTPEHEAAHEAEMTTKARREKSLAVCVAQDCAALVMRVEDGITTPRTAHQTVEWVLTQLNRDDLTHATRGRLYTALGVAASRTGDPDLIQWLFTVACDYTADEPACVDGAACDRCADPDSTRLCRFRAIRYALIAAFMYEDGVLSVERGHAFLPIHKPGTKRGRGHPPMGWFGKLVNTGHADAAGYGATLVAKTGPDAHTAGHQRLVLEYAWRKGGRGASLADAYSHRILGDGSDEPDRPHLTDALTICDEALADRGDDTGRVWDRITSRRERILQRQAAPPRTPPETVRNGRTPRPSRFILR